MAETAIEWATHVWNPVTGCDRVSPGCANCYALTYAGRLKAMGQPKYQRDGGRASGPGFGVTCHDAEVGAPLRWRKPRPRVFEFINRVWMSMRNAPQHNYLILTKRPERLLEWTRIAAHAKCWPINEIWPPWIWLGVSIENRRFVHRADVLREVPMEAGGVRFISAEPLLGPLLHDGGRVDTTNGSWSDFWTDGYAGPELDLEGIDWLIAGGESGTGHRPIRSEWLDDLRDACRLAGAAFFFKQWGGHTPKAGGRLLDGRTWDELPSRARSLEVAHA